MFPIEKGIPIQSCVRGIFKYLYLKSPIDKMEVGDSFLLSHSSVFRNKKCRIQGFMAAIHKRTPKKRFTHRFTPEGIRIWRIEDRDYTGTPIVQYDYPESIIMEKGIPIPLGSYNQKYPWQYLAIGNSFTVPLLVNSDRRQKTINSVRFSRSRYQKYHKPKKFCTRVFTEYIRVWRIEDNHE